MKHQIVFQWIFITAQNEPSFWMLFSLFYGIFIDKKERRRMEVLLQFFYRKEKHCFERIKRENQKMEKKWFLSVLYHFNYLFRFLLAKRESKTCKKRLYRLLNTYNETRVTDINLKKKESLRTCLIAIIFHGLW